MFQVTAILIDELLKPCLNLHLNESHFRSSYFAVSFLSLLRLQAHELKDFIGFSGKQAVCYSNFLHSGSCQYHGIIQDGIGDRITPFHWQMMFC